MLIIFRGVVHSKVTQVRDQVGSTEGRCVGVWKGGMTSLPSQAFSTIYFVDMLSTIYSIHYLEVLKRQWLGGSCRLSINQKVCGLIPGST